MGILPMVLHGRDTRATNFVRAGLAGLAGAAVFCLALQGGILSAEEATDSSQPEKKEARLALEECLRRALEENLSLAAQALNIGIAEQGVVGAQAPFDSQFALDLLYERAKSQEEGTDSDRRRGELTWSKRARTGQTFRISHSMSRLDRDADTPISPFYDLDWTFTATQPLAKGAGRTANMAPVWTAENQRKKTVLMTTEFIMDLINTIEGTYLDLSYAIRYLEVRRSALKLAQELLARNEELVRVQKLPGRSIEVLQAKAAVAAREEEIIVSRNAIAKTEDAIHRLMNLPVRFEGDRPPLVPADEPMIDLEVPKVEESLSFALAHRPEVQALKLDLDSARLELAAARNNRLPEVGLRADLGLAGSETGYGSSLDELAEGRNYVWQAGISVSIPWGNRAARSRYARAKLSYRKAKILFQNFLEELRLNVINAHRDIDRDLKRIATTKASLEQTQLQLQTEKERFAQQMSNSFRILQFQDDLIEAQIRHLAATIDFNRSYFNLLRVEGQAIRNERFDLTDIVEKMLPRLYPSRRRWSPGKGFAG